MDQTDVDADWKRRFSYESGDMRSNVKKRGDSVVDGIREDESRELARKREMVNRVKSFG